VLQYSALCGSVFSRGYCNRAQTYSRFTEEQSFYLYKVSMYRVCSLYYLLSLPSSNYLFTVGVEGFYDFTWSHWSTHHIRQDSSGRGTGPSQRPLRDNTNTVRDKHPYPRWDSNPRSQQALGRRPKPWKARPLWSAVPCIKPLKANRICSM
jgi:hypothetical protein